MSRDNACSLDEQRPRPHAHTQHSASESTAETPWATAAERQRTRHAGNTEPDSRPPRTQKGARRMGTPNPSNSSPGVSNTGYLKHPQARSCAWGKTEAGGAPTVRCTSTEPADPRHPITTHTPVPFTWLRPGQTNRNPEASATRLRKHRAGPRQHRRTRKQKNQGQIDSTSRRHHAMPGVGLQNPCTATYKMRCAQGELRHARGHGAQPPRPKVGLGRGGITPCTRQHLPPPSHSELRKRSFSAPESMGVSPHVLGLATSELASVEGASRHAPGCTYRHPRTASCARDASVRPRAWGSVPTSLA